MKYLKCGFAALASNAAAGGLWAAIKKDRGEFIPLLILFQLLQQ